jgi:hypothetical protein
MLTLRQTDYQQLLPKGGLQIKYPSGDIQGPFTRVFLPVWFRQNGSSQAV